MNFMPIRRVAAASFRGTSKRLYSSALSKAEIEATKAEASVGSDTWKKISIYLTIPLCMTFGVVLMKDEMEHIHHLGEHPAVHEPFEYLRVHRKDFPFGDGKRTLFFNPLVNEVRE
ncbi:Cytochrome c oxidase subunit 6A, mitochondrial [Zancudomyces culisetae]|uniref:Cytochrome c oxidase subunit 6A, mitochondrial n=1 Tax=Zancudomyces culisetae TaxID=1213189 RepID=A0A1R1PCD5_ZANCU|nr:Cytochrome c oxidase subunit 6A, mitochondrial [Zancudomyces culisetae]OMH82360.1 Cytochrome c oxidase subunit 6A, mitochondrial [Zancudomyces culisetae]|eukprot:OMH78624.1 Cytochrome c oxidase subunit 6A, mitochondrial [Zancudomyces culisetae]